MYFSHLVGTSIHTVTISRTLEYRSVASETNVETVVTSLQAQKKFTSLSLLRLRPIHAPF